MGDEIQTQDGKGTKTSKASKRPRNIAPKPAQVKVGIIECQGQTVLVEYDLGAGPQRVFVPQDKLKGNDVDDDVLAAGIPYGEDWTTWVDDEHGKDFAKQLYATQIWTKKDFLARSNEARAAMQRIYVNDPLKKMLHRAASK